MIRNAVLHILNEQPLLADLFDLPAPGDAGLLCTNVRTMDGKRPVFIDRVESTFYFPYLHIRFLELPTIVDDGTGRPAAFGSRRGAPAVEPVGDLDDLESGLVEDTAFVPGSDSLLPVPVGDDDDLDGFDDLDIDEEFLRRVRDV